MSADRISNGYVPDFDIDRKLGAQAELWVDDLIESLSTKGRTEVKAPKPFLQKGSPYIEMDCRGRDGKWRPSGIKNSTAEQWVLKCGALPFAWVIETEWLRRAAWRASENRQWLSEHDGSNPTQGVFVTMRDIWETRPFNPDGSTR